MNFFRAPAAARALKTLDRSLYTRMIPTSVACVRENRNISKYRKMLQKTNEILQLEKVDCIIADPDAALAAQGRKCIILTPEFKGSGSFSSLSFVIRRSRKLSSPSLSCGVAHW